MSVRSPGPGHVYEQTPPAVLCRKSQFANVNLQVVSRVDCQIERTVLQLIQLVRSVWIVGAKFPVQNRASE